ncbi:MAG: trehalose-6-phosphate synthase [Elusimicrobia bacterium]|nr:trehalose-6-phosphate synthase [Elusimicrobiota bacterium]
MALSRPFRPSAVRRLVSVLLSTALWALSPGLATYRALAQSFEVPVQSKGTTSGSGVAPVGALNSSLGPAYSLTGGFLQPQQADLSTPGLESLTIGAGARLRGGTLTQPALGLAGPLSPHPLAASPQTPSPRGLTAQTFAAPAQPADFRAEPVQGAFWGPLLARLASPSQAGQAAGVSRGENESRVLSQWRRWLGEKDRGEFKGDPPSGGGDGRRVPKGGALEPHESLPFFKGRIYDGEAAARERIDNRRYKRVVVFDMNKTLEARPAGKDKERVIGESIYPGNVRIRPDILEDIKRLKAAGMKVVLWTQANKAWTRKLLAEIPEAAAFAGLFDRIITEENYMAITEAERRANPEVAARIVPSGGGKDAALFKDLRHLGYDVLIDDRADYAAFAARAGFVYRPIRPLQFEPGDGDGEITKIVNEFLLLERLVSAGRKPGAGAQILEIESSRATMDLELGRDPLVVLINRSPYSLSLEGGALSLVRSPGGAAPAIDGALKAGGGGLVLAAAMSAEERALAAYGKILATKDGVWLRYVDIPEETLRGYYTGFSNSILWGAQHGISRRFTRRKDAEVRELFRDYRAANRLFAAELGRLFQRKPRGRLMTQDYHLYLAPKMMRDAGTRGVLQQFVHIPWPTPAVLRETVPGPLEDVLKELLEGLLGNDIVGFHTKTYARNFMKTVEQTLGSKVSVDLEKGIVRFEGREIWVRPYPISVDPDYVLAASRSVEALQMKARLHGDLGEKGMLLRVDRLDPSKGAETGFAAYERFFELYPEMVGNVVFYAIVQPSRTDNDDYKELARQTLRTVGRINARFTPAIVAGGWSGDVQDENDFHRRVAANHGELPAIVAQTTGATYPKALGAMASLSRLKGSPYVGAILINPEADGMNLVAKEAAIVLGEDAGDPALEPGRIILSRSAGAFEELGAYVIPINDATSVDETARRMHEALTGAGPDGRAKAAAAAQQVKNNDLKTWFDAMMRDIQARAPPTPWGRFTQLATALGATAFFLVQIPQIATNFFNLGFLPQAAASFVASLLQLPAANAALIAGVPWIAFTVGIFSLALILFDMVDKKDAGTAALQQVFGMAMGTIVLATSWLALGAVAASAPAYALLMPALAFGIVAPAAAGAIGAYYLRRRGLIPDAAWRKIVRAGELLAFGALAQALWTLAAGPAALGYLLPGGLAMAAAYGMRRLEETQRLPAGWPDYLRWPALVKAARMLLNFYGLLAIILSGFANPATVEGLSLWSILLGMWGNLLAVPKATADGAGVWKWKSLYDGLIGSGAALYTLWYFGVLAGGPFAALLVAGFTFAAVVLGRDLYLRYLRRAR